MNNGSDKTTNKHATQARIQNPQHIYPTNV